MELCACAQAVCGGSRTLGLRQSVVRLGFLQEGWCRRFDAPSMLHAMPCHAPLRPSGWGAERLMLGRLHLCSGLRMAASLHALRISKFVEVYERTRPDQHHVLAVHVQHKVPAMLVYGVCSGVQHAAGAASTLCLKCRARHGLSKPGWMSSWTQEEIGS